MLFDIVGALGDALLSAVGLVVYYIVELITFLLNIISGVLLGYVIGSVPTLVPDPARNFLPLIEKALGGEENLGRMLSGWQTMAVALLFVVATVMTAYMTAADNSKDTPKGLLKGTLAGMVLVLFSYRICYLLFLLFFGSVEGKFGGLTGWFVEERTLSIGDAIIAFFKMGAPDGNLWEKILGGFAVSLGESSYDPSSMPNAYMRYLLIGRMIVTAVLGLSLAIQVISLAVEMMQRWVNINLLYLASPFAGAALPSEHTKEFTFKFYDTLFSSCLVLMLNHWVFTLAIAALTNYPDADVNEWGGTVYMVFIFCLLGVAMKLDEILRHLGLSPLRTGYNMAHALFAGAGTIMAGASIARTGVAAYKGVEKGLQAHAATQRNQQAAGGAQNLREAIRVSENYARKGTVPPANEMSRNMTLDAMKAAGAQKGVKYNYQGEMAKRLFENSAGNKLPAGASFTATGNSFDLATGTGHYSIRNADGSISKGTVSMGRSNGGKLMSNEGHTPLYFKEDRGAAPIGGSLTSGMPDGRNVHADDYAKTHPQVSPDTLNALGADKDISDYRKTAANVVAGIDADGEAVVAFSQDPRTFAGHQVTDAEHASPIETMPGGTFPHETRADHLATGEVMSRLDYEASLPEGVQPLPQSALEAVGAGTYTYIQKDNEAGDITLFDHDMSPIVTLHANQDWGFNSDGTPNMGDAYTDAYYAPGHGGAVMMNGQALYGSNALVPYNVPEETKRSYGQAAASDYASRLNLNYDNEKREDHWEVDDKYKGSSSQYEWCIVNKSTGEMVIGTPVTEDGKAPQGCNYAEGLMYKEGGRADFYVRLVKPKPKEEKPKH